MKMSRKTRIVSIVMCIALMMGIMSVGMMASAANSETPAIQWNTTGGHLWGPNNLQQVGDGYVSINGVGSGVSDAQWTIGGWDKAYQNLGNFAGCDGATFTVKIESAGGNARQLNANLKLFCGGVCFQSGQAINVGGGAVQVTLPFENFVADGAASRVITEAEIAAIDQFQFVINSYGVFYGSNITDAVYTVSDIYGYTGEPDVITLPGEEPVVTTTQAPTTPAPQTTTKKEEPVVTTTQAPTTLAPTTAPVVEEKEAKPAKVKGVKVKAGKKKVTVTWKKAKNAKKYTVKYSYKKNMKGAKTKTVKAAKVVLKKLKSGKKVYVQVCGVNGKTKGAFSKKVAKKVK